MSLSPLAPTFPAMSSMSSEDSKRGSMKSTGLDSGSSGHCSLLAVDLKNFKALWNEEVYQNRERWKAQASKGTPNALRRSSP